MSHTIFFRKSGSIHQTDAEKAREELDDGAISDSAWRLYVLLHRLYYTEDQIVPSLGRIGFVLGIAEGQIIQLLHALEGADRIVITQQHGHRFYNVFETREECRAFRQNPILEVGERVVPKGGQS